LSNEILQTQPISTSPPFGSINDSVQIKLEDAYTGGANYAKNMERIVEIKKKKSTKDLLDQLNFSFKERFLSQS
jgi:hypothetical protein